MSIVAENTAGGSGAVFFKIKRYNPVVTLISPTGSILSNPVKISYKTTDASTLGYALGLTPVSIFYSDKSSDWYGNQLANPANKISIVSKLPAIGSYTWITKDLATNGLYRLIVDATNLSGMLGEAVSNFFSLDFTPPTFAVKTDPELVRKGSVKITVIASKDLSVPPQVNVIQRNGASVLVNMAGDQGQYQGVYTVLPGYDGTAHISVSGTDIAGNAGAEITSGGTFDIGINPPPLPNIISNLDKVTGTSTVTIAGTIREDTQAVLVVNGEGRATSTPDAKGNFSFQNIALDKIKNHGVNYISIVAVDPLGTEGPSVDIAIKYNIPPTVSIAKPASEDYLSGQVSIVSDGADENQDPLLYSYQIIPLTDFQSTNPESKWITLANKVTDTSYSWDSTQIDNGEYMIRVIAFDGNAYATSTAVHVYVKNTLPYVRFEDGERTITKNSSVTISGHAFVADGRRQDLTSPVFSPVRMRVRIGPS